MTKRWREERKRRLRDVERVERDTFAESMPISSTAFLGLLDWLDVELERCDHTTKLTEQYLRELHLEPEAVLPWLADHGGYCDCEVFSNLYDLSEPFRPEPVLPIPSRRGEKKARSLQVAPGWDLTALPKPWRVSNLYRNDEPLSIQLGKRNECTITFVPSALPEGDQLSEAYWSRLWSQRNELPEKSPLIVTHDALDISALYRSTLVSTSGWLPVYCWVVPSTGTWYLEVRTDSRRRRTDLPQVAKLLTQLETKGS